MESAWACWSATAWPLESRSPSESAMGWLLESRLPSESVMAWRWPVWLRSEWAWANEQGLGFEWVSR